MSVERLCVVIPTLNAEKTLGATLGCLPRGPEIIVVDGGSTDGTIGLAKQARARVASAPRGRGPQLAHGAGLADRPWLLFLHADTVLESGWVERASAFMATPKNESRAAVFRLRFDDQGVWLRLFERMVLWRTRWLGLPYGDQGLLIARAFYESIGGHRPLPLMEDVDLVRRIGRHRLVVLDAVARTSAVRYRRHGYLARAVRNLLCLALYLCRVPPSSIARLYGGPPR